MSETEEEKGTEESWFLPASRGRAPILAEEDRDTADIISLRPTAFADYVGQETLRANLAIACSAAQQRRESLDHVLLHGPPGLGKTSLARIMSHELGVGFHATSGPILERAGDLAALLTSLEPRDVLFIDEIHRLPRVVEEVLYPALEDFTLDIMIGQGPTAKSVQVGLQPFTLVGATTRTGLLTSPLRDRFGLTFRLTFYSIEELTTIVQRSAKLLGLSIEAEAASEIARRSRGTPRLANRLLKRVRDFAQHLSADVISCDHAREALRLLEVDEKGLDPMDRILLKVVIEKFSGGPVGLGTIAAAVGEEKHTIEDVYEPFLIQEGLLARTRQGRCVTSRAYEHLGLVPPPRVEDQLPLDFTVGESS